jgi:hypothetical protein
MRIDSNSLLAAQSALQARAPVQPPQATAKPLFEPLNFPRAEPADAPRHPVLAEAEKPPLRPGARLDITV